MDRLVAYRPPGGDDLAMVATYFWNVALCQALYPTLGAVEVSMRNAIHDALTAHFRTAAWYDRPNLLLARELAQVVEAKRKIQRTRKAVIPPRVVAALNYGFWTSILDTGYGTSIWSARNPAILVRQAFPQAPLHLQVRGRAHQRFNEIRFLRNRVFHYEPIWQGVPMPNGRIAHLVDLHAGIVEAIGWVDPTLRSTIEAFDTFPSSYRTGRQLTQRQIEQHLGLP